ncbi:hypothetical protein GRAN_3157 [Granulicella sibirica]|uniref:Uncharacterized protein n=1 Tax=Granulicella sibirica TaxID=2479048 RepID=A0A4Q0T1P7_9BACT|nr:hypothetical protein GRAN_3157 [Granulicella sibirica]
MFGVGWVLRHMSFVGGIAKLPSVAALFSAPEKAVRGHQIGYRMKNNTYDAWTLGQFEQQIRDLAIFGTNTIQIIAPVSDDAAVSPLMPAPPLETVVGISRLAAKYGLDCALYYPEMRKDYSNPTQFEAEERDFEALVRAMPRVDALYVPGGDPGHTPPGVLFPLVKAEAEVVRRWHPGATVWVSAQGFDAGWFEEFYGLLAKEPEWLTGVFFGPQSRDGMEVQRRRIPARYPVIFYPDIAHTMHAQFPVPGWDPVFALTEGREPICPRPEAFAAIYRHFAGLNAGFVTYSEGVNDDVNKIVWTRLGWDPGETVEEMLREYARWFLHREGTQETLAVEAMLGLEKDWVGPVAANAEIGKTFGVLAELEKTDSGEGNWRWESLLYRGYYDAYVQRRFRREQAVEAAALSRLVSGGESGARAAGALRVLSESAASEDETRERERLFDLAGKLFRDGGLQLSVKLYGASNWERGANLDRVDTPLNDRVWMERAIAGAMKASNEAGRLKGLEEIARWNAPVDGALYDDLGDAAREPHLVRGAGWSEDPEMYAAAIDGIADKTLADGWRLSWLSYAEALYEQPLEMRYEGLAAGESYRLRITYAGEDYSVPLTLTAGNGVVIHEARKRGSNPETVEFDLPSAAIVGGELTLRWMRAAGGGGSGRGRQVAEVWLLPVKPR